MSYVFRTHVHSFFCTFVICSSMTNGNNNFIFHFLNKVKSFIYIWCQCNQSDLISGGFITFSEERCIRNRNIFSGLCAFLFNINQWPFHIYTDNMSKLVGWLYFRGSSKNIHKLVFSKCHRSRTVGSNTVFFFIL